jgi:hypothetical protein
VRGYRAAVGFLLAGMLAAALPAVAHASDQEGCLICHRLGLLAAREGGRQPLDVRDLPGGVHAELYCSDCHPDSRAIPHTAPPGPSSCIGECHGSKPGVPPSHRRAAFGGLTETHRRVTSPRPPCLGCHAEGDAKGSFEPVEARCAGCHRKESLSVREGPHWRMGRGPGHCAGCHPAHPEGVSGKSPAICAGPACHARTTARMRAIVDHRAADSGPQRMAKGAVFLAFAGAGWFLGGAARPRRPSGRGPG